MRPMREELPIEEWPSALNALAEREYQERYWDAVCDYWQAVAEYLAMIQRGGKPN